jgi:uncharacterized membrane protein YeaQ/YmgE (transglycosylase-associated protein family)
MTKPRLDGLYFFLFGSAMFLLLGIGMESAAPTSLTDFRGLYYPARCLIQKCDPYQESDVLRIAQAQGGIPASDGEQERQVVTQNVYLPTAFFFTVPFAMLPWGPAHLLWMGLTAGSFILASFLAWDLGAGYAPILSGVLIGFLLANSEVPLITGNAAGIVISFCAIAGWCFLRERFVLVGILCLAVGLALKPQDAGLVWLYFLLAGGIYRRRALQTLLATVVLGLPGVLWVGHIAPLWFQELHSNLQAYSVRGMNDPGLAAPSLVGAINLQTVFSAFWNDPRIYNLLTYFVCGALVLVWILVTLRSRSSQRRSWLALASIAALSMLPVYHRQYDDKLLLLTIPACAMLWAQKGILGRLALLVTSTALVLTGDIPSMILLNLYHRLPVTGLSAQLSLHALVFRTPLVLLIVGIFYLWVYATRTAASADSGTPATPPLVP